MKCPKCATEALDSARFCPRCHATLLYICPACAHTQREGGRCEKCGVDFLKYVTAMVSQEREKAEATHRRSALMRNILWAPLTGGISLLRQLFHSRERGA